MSKKDGCDIYKQTRAKNWTEDLQDLKKGICFILGKSLKYLVNMYCETDRWIYFGGPAVFIIMVVAGKLTTAKMGAWVNIKINYFKYCSQKSFIVVPSCYLISINMVPVSAPLQLGQVQACTRTLGYKPKFWKECMSGRFGIF